MSASNTESNLTASPVNIEQIIAGFDLILKECDELFEHHKVEILIIKSQCDKLLNGLKSASRLNEQKTSHILRQYAKMVLDVTYIKENQLVEEEFPEDDGYSRMLSILDLLKQPENLLHQVCGPKACSMAILDEEMAECLHWRKGALCYMYCKTIWGNTERVNQHGQDIINCLVNSISEIQAMLSVRAPVSTEGGITTNSRDTVKLLSQGIFSDTHVLALMYAGEMCFWHRQLKQTINQSNPDQYSTTVQSDASSKHSTGHETSHKDSNAECVSKRECTAMSPYTANCATQTYNSEVSFDSQALGKQFLQRYMDVVTGPLRSAGWDSGRAKELLEQLKL